MVFSKLKAKLKEKVDKIDKFVDDKFGKDRVSSPSTPRVRSPRPATHKVYFQKNSVVIRYPWAKIALGCAAVCALAFAYFLMFPRTWCYDPAMGNIVATLPILLLMNLAFVKLRPNAKEEMVRYPLVDWIRGLTIGFMCMFHWTWDMVFMHLVEFKRQPDWLQNASDMEFGLATFAFVAFMIGTWICITPHCPPLAHIIYVGGAWYYITNWQLWSSFTGVFAFMTCIGMSSAISFERTANLQKFMRKQCIRCAQLCGAALVVTIATYIQFPRRFVTFGAVHCIAVVSVLHLPLLKFPRVAGVLWIVMILGWLHGDYYVEPEIHLTVRGTVDYMRVWQNLAFVFLGIYLHSIGFHKITSWRIPGGKRFFPNDQFLCKMSKFGLPIYVLHQVVLFPLALGLGTLCEHQHKLWW